MILFFKIPIGKTGREGSYSDGVSYGFFDELFKDKTVNPEKLIVEDLGEIREETIALRKKYGFTRQKKYCNFQSIWITYMTKRIWRENVLCFPRKS